MKWTIVLLTMLSLLLVGCGAEAEPTVDVEEMQYCETAQDCVYVDNSCCPFTDHSNIVAINAMYKDAYELQGPDCGDMYACIELYAHYEYGPDCVENQCVIVTYDDMIEAQEYEELEAIMEQLEVAVENEIEEDIVETQEEISEEVEEEQLVEEFTITANEYAFDPEEIEVTAGALVRITFEYEDNKIYYGGLDITCDDCEYFDKIAYRKDGEPDVIEFTAEESFSYSGYWPASSAKKATGTVTVVE